MKRVIRLVKRLYYRWIVKEYLRGMKKFYKQQFAATATGESIDKIGALHALIRSPGESDSDYRARLYEHMCCPAHKQQ